MENPTNLSTVKRTKKACTECRQQKARCDVHIRSPDPCSRCRRLSHQCIISDPFKRQKRRQRFSELEEEARLLRQELSINSSTTSIINGPSAEPTLPQASDNRNNQILSLAQKGRYSIDVRPEHPANNVRVFSAPTTEKTIARSLDGVQVDAETIDGIFQLYFQRYHHFVPLLDPLPTPNFYFNRSPLLFWAIIGVAYPSYSSSRGFLESLFPKIYDLAFLHLNPKHASIPTIEGLLIIINWPFPLDSLTRDTQLSLCGGTLHIAMQMGIHVPMSIQDFARVKIELSEEDVRKRAELWVHCLLVYERACNCQGLAPINLVDTQRETGISSKVSSSLSFQLKLHSIVSQCCITLQEHGLRTLSATQERSLEMMIRMFEGQLKDAEPDAGNAMDLFYLTTCRMTIQMFYFFLKPTSIQNEIVIRLYMSARQILISINELSKKHDLRTSTFYFPHAIILSCYTMFRLLKSPSVQYLNQAEAKSTFFEAVETMYQVALPGYDDLARRNHLHLPQLLRSDKALRKDGKDFSMLRIRSRLTMSPIADVAWWWREEFGGQMGAYTSNKDEAIHGEHDPDNQTEFVGDQGGANRNPDSDMGLGMLGSEFWDHNLMAEFGWLGGEDMLEHGGQDDSFV